jgi:hypothetical protein
MEEEEYISVNNLKDFLKRITAIAIQKRDRIIYDLPLHEKEFIDTMSYREQLIYYLSRS